MNISYATVCLTFLIAASAFLAVNIIILHRIYRDRFFFNWTMAFTFWMAALVLMLLEELFSGPAEPLSIGNYVFVLVSFYYTLRSAGAYSSPGRSADLPAIVGLVIFTFLGIFRIIGRESEVFRIVTLGFCAAVVYFYFSRASFRTGKFPPGKERATGSPGSEILLSLSSLFFSLVWLIRGVLYLLTLISPVLLNMLPVLDRLLFSLVLLPAMILLDLSIILTSIKQEYRRRQRTVSHLVFSQNDVLQGKIIRDLNNFASELFRQARQKLLQLKVGEEGDNKKLIPELREIRSCISRGAGILNSRNDMLGFVMDKVEKIYMGPFVQDVNRIIGIQFSPDIGFELEKEGLILISSPKYLFWVLYILTDILASDWLDSGTENLLLGVEAGGTDASRINLNISLPFPVRDLGGVFNGFERSSDLEGFLSENLGERLERFYLLSVFIEYFFRGRLSIRGRIGPDGRRTSKLRIGFEAELAEAGELIAAAAI